MKRILSFLTIFFLAMALIIALTPGCEGPEGPAGPQGVSGVDGTDGADGVAGADGEDGEDGLGANSCFACHNSSTILKAKIMQYQTSGHYTGTSYSRGTSASCAVCHSHEGFAQKVAGEEVTGASSPTPVGCRSCHKIHTTYSDEDYDLTTTAAVTLAGDYAEGKLFDMGESNLCANCHQARVRNYGIVVDGEGDITIGAHFGPHHGTQANVLVGAGLIKINGSTAYSNSMHSTAVADGCVTCHLATKNHDFKPVMDACTKCHTDATDFDIDGEQTAVAELIVTLTEKLVAEGLIEFVEADGLYEPITGAVTTHNKAAAVFNYFGIVDDGSIGVHNPTYVKAILQNSIELFE